MRIDVDRTVKVFVFVIAIILLLSAGDGEVDCRKHEKKTRDGKGKRKGRRQRARRRDMHPVAEQSVDDDSSFSGVNMLDILKKQRAIAATATPPPTSESTIGVESWTAAEVIVGSESGGRLLSSRGKFGYHSKKHSVAGKLVHIKDHHMNSHFGCNDKMGNMEDIPTDRPWIALIKRGKCYFFNKIKLAELHNASAAIIYNDRHEKPEVMSSIGTNIVSLMINKADGQKIVSLVEAGKSLSMMIKVGKTHNKTNDESSADELPSKDDTFRKINSHKQDMMEGLPNVPLYTSQMVVSLPEIPPVVLPNKVDVSIKRNPHELDVIGKMDNLPNMPLYTSQMVVSLPEGAATPNVSNIKITFLIALSFTVSYFINIT